MDADSDFIVSGVTGGAHRTETVDWKAVRVIAGIKSERLGPQIKRIRALAKGGGRKAAHQAKLKLPAVLWSGRFSKRGAKFLVKHSGLLCADLDDLGSDRVPSIRQALTKSPHLWAVFSSPTGTGLKAVFKVVADAQLHQDSFAAVKAHVLDLAGVNVDEACADVSRLCFLSCDADAYLNEDAIELPPIQKTVKEHAVASRQLGVRQRIATNVLGAIDWKSDGKGYCECPGASLHTTGDGERDCVVLLTGAAPTIHCFHDHCKQVVEDKNKLLRANVARAERNQVRADAVAATETLPDPIDVLQLLNADLPKPAELVRGILHEGSKMVIGGGSKSFKTWSLIDLAISVATGKPWWGFDTEQGRVLYVNFEIQDFFFAERIWKVTEAKECQLDPKQFLYWGFRGRASDFGGMMLKMILKLSGQDIALIVIDPIYKGLGGRDENKAGDIASLLNEIEWLAVETGAAVAFGHHFSKGNQAAKDSIDRIGGSGVFARDPDSILTMTKHEEEDAFTVDAVLRNFPPIDSFVVQRMHPLMVRADELDPAALKKPGASQKYSDESLLALLDAEPLRTNAYVQLARQMLGISENGFMKRLKQLESRGAIQKVNREWIKVPSAMPH